MSIVLLFFPNINKVTITHISKKFTSFKIIHILLNVYTIFLTPHNIQGTAGPLAKNSDSDFFSVRILDGMSNNLSYELQRTFRKN